MYAHNKYQSNDLDFVTVARRDALSEALRPMWFALAKDRHRFTQPGTALFLEFPAGPLEFGDRIVHHEDIPRLDTPWGPLRVITPTQCVMDRLAANAATEGTDPGDIANLRQQAGLQA